MRAEHASQDVRSFEVKAGLIAKVLYGANQKVLVVHLRTGRSVAVYRYYDVPVETYDQLRAAASPAAAYTESVKKKGFRFERLVA